MSNFGAYWLGALVGLIFAVALAATLSVVAPPPGENPMTIAATPEAAAPQSESPAPAQSEAPQSETSQTSTAPTDASQPDTATPEATAPQAAPEAEENPAPVTTETATPQPTPAPETPIVTAEAEPTPAPAPVEEPEAEAEPETEATPEAAAPAPAAVNALRDHSERYRGDESQPLLSIVLIDLGDPALNVDEIFLLPSPLSIVINADADGAGSLVADARDAGFEALFAVDSAVLADLDAVLDDAGEIIGVATLGDDISSAEAISALADGLTVRSMGLFDASNSGGGAVFRAAQSIDLPAAPAGRRIDDTQNSEAVYQALERAAFDARRAGAFVVYARPDPAVMTGLRRWMSLKANRSVAVAPLSTVMRKLGRQ